MKHFPIHTYQCGSPRSFNVPKMIQTSQFVTIEELRKENEFLKKQLSSLQMQTQIRHNNFASDQGFVQTFTSNNSEEDVEMSFRNKMTKLKSRKSTKKSVDHYGCTAPSSPKKHAQSIPLASYEQRKIQNITNFPKSQLNYKMMAIELDENGRYHRDKEKQDNMTVRYTMTQPTFYQSNNNSPAKISTNCYPMTHKNQIPSRAKGHQRVQSSFENYRNFVDDKTQRFFPKSNETPFRPSVNGFSKQKHRQSNYQQDKRVIQMQPIPISPKRDCAPFGYMNNMQKVPQQNIRPSLTSPRGNAYIQKIQAQQKKSEGNPLQSDLLIIDNSDVWIEKDLKEKKGFRKLRCDIYMSDDKEEV